MPEYTAPRPASAAATGFSLMVTPVADAGRRARPTRRRRGGEGRQALERKHRARKGAAGRCQRGRRRSGYRRAQTVPLGAARYRPGRRGANTRGGQSSTGARAGRATPAHRRGAPQRACSAAGAATEAGGALAWRHPSRRRRRRWPCARGCRGPTAAPPQRPSLPRQSPPPKAYTTAAAVAAALSTKTRAACVPRRGVWRSASDGDGGARLWQPAPGREPESPGPRSMRPKAGAEARRKRHSPKRTGPAGLRGTRACAPATRTSPRSTALQKRQQSPRTRRT